MHKVLVLTFATVMLVGCGHFGPRENVAALSSGMTREQVAEVLGAPLARHLKDAQEAWEYCINGWVVDDYVVVWFDGAESTGTLVELDSDAGHCSSLSRVFDWDMAPSS